MGDSTKYKKKVKDAANRAADLATSNWKPIVMVVGGIAVAYGLKNIIEGFTKSKDDPDAGGGTTEVKDPTGTSQGGTLTNGQVVTKAALLLAAMDGLGGVSSSQFQQIKNTLSNINAKDFWAISKAFGRPYRSPFTGEESNFYLSFGNDLSLVQWFSKELTGNQYNELKNHLPSGTI